MTQTFTVRLMETPGFPVGNHWEYIAEFSNGATAVICVHEEDEQINWATIDVWPLRGAKAKPQSP
jgi:hypothetical protein